MASPLHIIILAAGQGSRMRSSQPKVLHRIAGRALLHRVMDAAGSLKPAGIHVVIGHAADQVQAATPLPHPHWAIQSEQLGTGHAVAQALPAVPENARILILYGDVPLVDASTLADLVAAADSDTLSLLTVQLDEPTGYGRIVRDAAGRVTAIVEQKDATAAQLALREVNTGILSVMASRLRHWLPQLGNRNAQGEYYLTDIIAMAVADKMSIHVVNPKREIEVQGVNNRQQLAELERDFQWHEACRLMAAGATLADPHRLDVRGRVHVEQDVFIDANVLLEGEVYLGHRVCIGPNVVIRNSRIGDDTQVHAFSMIEDSRIAEQAEVGPYARLRPGTQLARKAKIGNFVEIKKSVIGESSKVNHLSYVGDATLGEGVNVGAGTITCNYDGANKHQTVIGDQVFVGSNTALVAPVTIGTGATIGAGSTITQNVADHQLAVARSKQRQIDDWKRPVKDQ